MDIKRAKEVLNGVATGTATRHPKLLIADLAAVVGFLLVELEKANEQRTVPQISIEHTKSLQELSDEAVKKPSVRLPLVDPNDTQYGEMNPRKRMGNAGDAE